MAAACMTLAKARDDTGVTTHAVSVRASPAGRGPELTDAIARGERSLIGR